MMVSNDPTKSRTQRQLVLPEVVHNPNGAPVRRGLYVDCETTGFDWARDEVVEVGLLPFTCTADGRIAQVLHGEAQTHLRDPGRPISEAMTALTGLTDDDVRGRHIDVEAASALIASSELLIAHNARFDRPFFERVLPVTREKPWACSRLEIPWRASGTNSDALHCLLCHYGAFARDRHRALADCEAGVWLLAQDLPGTGRTALSVLLERSAAQTVRLWAVGAPFEAKGVLRARGYRWMPQTRNGIARSWWTEVEPEMVDAECAWLNAEVHEAFRPAYRTGPAACAPVLRRVTARERWRSDPAACASPAPGGVGPAR